LSGSEITLGERTETLRVKVASIPGIRLQVYFMDNDYYFKRKGIYADRQGKLFEDNLERSVFYARAVIRTIRNLGWQPDLIHAFGWLSGMVPYVLRTEFGDDDLFKDAKVVYTPDAVDFEARIDEAGFANLSLKPDERLIGQEPSEAGQTFADAVLLAPGSEGTSTAAFSGDKESEMEEAISVYQRFANSVPA